MKYAIGCDHSAVDMKDTIIDYLKSRKVEVWDCGTTKDKPEDYPDIAQKVAEIVSLGECDFGIIICGTGIGVSITANKVPGIRCALCNDTFSAKMAREHNDANMLALGARVIGIELALYIVETFLDSAPNSNERHLRRVAKITKADEKYRKNISDNE